MKEAEQRHKKRKRRLRGQQAESLASLFLRLKGYRILARNFRSPVGEIDIVASKKDVVVFAEVKTRNTDAEAREAISPRQRDRIVRASQVFLQNNPACHNHTQRFDAVLILPWRWPVHITNAWQTG